VGRAISRSSTDPGLGEKLTTAEEFMVVVLESGHVLLMDGVADEA
jgi:hypothetical protein